jgi:hypothetical protein
LLRETLERGTLLARLDEESLAALPGTTSQS